MLTISPVEIQKAGGILAALTEKSCEYIRSILPTDAMLGFGGAESNLERIIVHTNPHLDEYFAELMFRLCLPQEKRSCEFLEQSIFSKTNDLACQHLWPTAAVLGIGGTVSGGTRPLFLLDEHVIDEDIGKSARSASSCSALVAQMLLRHLPTPLGMLLREVNAIDEYGNAHQQSLANLIKQLHEVRFAFKIDPASDKYVRDTLTPDWKRAIVDASIAAIVYCLEEKIDLIGNPDEKKKSLDESFTHYKENCAHRGNPYFPKAENFLGSTYGDQTKFFAEAILKKNETHNGKRVKVPIMDAAGNEIPQLLLLSRVIFACEHCWGTNLRDIIATHFWEVAMLGQLNFYPAQDAIREMFDKNVNRMVSPVGFLRREILPPMNLGGGWRCPVWIVSIAPDSSAVLPNRAIVNYINENNNIDPRNKREQKGCGLVLVQDTFRGTSVLFKCSGVPEHKWRQLVDLIKTRENECWHVVSNPDGGIASFIVNGNKAHQYVPRTGLDVTTLAALVRRTFY